MIKRTWGRGLLFFLASGAGVIALVLLVLRLSGYFVEVHRDGGREVGAEALRFGAAEGTDPLPPGAFAAHPRNVIFLIADGMGPAHVAAARSQLAGPDGRLLFERMPVWASISTHGRTRLVPDSGASATALASGWKTESGMLGYLPDGSRPPSVAEAARERGMAIGLVTTSYLLDATPAAFVVHVSNRSDLPTVARQMAASGAEVLLGEMPEEISKEAEGQLLAPFQDLGWRMVREWEELEAPGDASRVAGFFEPQSIRLADREPSLSRLAAFALERLAEDPDGFFLMIETEETDTASHLHDAERMVAGIAELDAVARAAVDFARRDGETLVLLTADHEAGGLSLISGSNERGLGVRWSTDGHTGVPVPLYAYGPGAERFAGVRDNTEIARALADLLGLELGEPVPGPVASAGDPAP